MRMEYAWRFGVVIGLFLVASAVFSLSNSPATAQGSGSPGPTRVATVDLVKLVNGLEQFRAGQRESDDYTSRLRSDVESARVSVDNARTDLEAATDATRDQLFEDFVQAVSGFRSEAASFDVLRFARQNVILRETWATIRAGIADYANDNGIDLIISDDSRVQADISLDSDPEAFKQFMMSRRVLFAEEAIDITDELITRMNVEYRASLGASDESQ